MKVHEFHVRTASALVSDLTGTVAGFVDGEGDGLVSVFVPHATAGLALMEIGAGSEEDLQAALERLFPREAPWRHRHGSPGHGRDHVVPAFIAPSIVMPVREGRLLLGTWQSIVLVDTNVDNRDRRVVLSFLGDAPS